MLAPFNLPMDIRRIGRHFDIAVAGTDGAHLFPSPESTSASTVDWKYVKFKF